MVLNNGIGMTGSSYFQGKELFVTLHTRTTTSQTGGVLTSTNDGFVVSSGVLFGITDPLI